MLSLQFTGRACLHAACALALAALVPTAASASEPAWSASAGAHYLSRYIRQGIDAANGEAAFRLRAKLKHTGGLGGGAEMTAVGGSSAGLLDWGIFGSYDHDFSDHASIDASFEHYSYGSDSASVLSSLANEISLGLDLTFEPLTISAFNSLYLGETTADYFGVGASCALGREPWTFIPAVDFNFGSQVVPGTIAKKLKGKYYKNGAALDVTVSGLTGVVASATVLYAAARGVTLSATPAILFTKQDALNSQSTIASISLGISYRIGF